MITVYDAKEYKEKFDKEQKVEEKVEDINFDNINIILILRITII